jgi:hypothetical protein
MSMKQFAVDVCMIDNEKELARLWKTASSHGDSLWYELSLSRLLGGRDQLIVKYPEMFI